MREREGGRDFSNTEKSLLTFLSSRLGCDQRSASDLTRGQQPCRYDKVQNDKGSFFIT